MKTYLSHTFSYGFRPFFILSAAYAIYAIVTWVLFTQGISFNNTWANSIVWHIHEMVFGFAIATVAGFLLTAVPNWTGIPNTKGKPLVALVILWIAGRIALNIPELPAYVAMTVDIMFIPSLALTLAVPLIKSKNYKNLVFIALLTVLTICNIAIHLGNLNIISPSNVIPSFISTVVILQMIVIISGRIIPFFTKMALEAKGTKIEVKEVNHANIVSIIGFPTLAITALFIGYKTNIFAAICLVVATAHLIRLSRWHSLKTLNNPVLVILHVGYLWIPIGLIMLAMHISTGFSTFQAIAHAFTTGVISTMILGMMSRVALGHTGRMMKVSPAITLSFALVQITTILRVLCGILPESYNSLLLTSSILWAVAFGLFLIIYVPILITARK